MSNGTTVTAAEKKPTYCKWCGRVEITFSDAFKSKSGKYIPIEKASGVPHKCNNQQQQSEPQQIATSSNSQQPTQQSSTVSAKNAQTEEQQPSVLEKVTEESIQKGITAQKKFEDLVIEVEGIGIDVNQTRIGLERLENKVDRLINLVFATEGKKE